MNAFYACAISAILSIATAVADVPPVPPVPPDPAPASAPAAVAAVAGRYAVSAAAEAGACTLVLEAMNRDAFGDARDDFQVDIAATDIACLKRQFAGALDGVALWNVGRGGSILLLADEAPRRTIAEFIPAARSGNYTATLGAVSLTLDPS